MDETAMRSGNGTLTGVCSTRCRSLALAFVLFSCSFSLANAQGWNGSGPFPPDAKSGTVNALAIDPVTGTVYAGTASGTVFALADATLSESPAAFDDGAVTKPGIAIGIDVLSNDVDPEGALDVTSVALQAVPADGTASANSDGSVTYTPGDGFVGSDSFTYTVRDAAGNASNVATVSVRVNAPPTAADDTAGTLRNEPVTIDVLANDADSDGLLDPATVVISDPPANGSAITEADGRITYAPAVDFTGVDTFSYRVGDDDGGVSGGAAVTVTVSEPPNIAPVANDDVASVMQGESVAVPVLANDSDADGTLDTASVTLQGAPGNGSAQVGAGGSIVYTPDAGFAGTDTLTYTVADDDGATSNSAAVSITVIAPGGGNMAPVASNDIASTQEDVPVDIDVLANDSDADGTLDATTVTVQSEPSDGTTEVNGDGTVTYAPDAGFNGTDSFTYTVADDDGAVSNAATVSITVTAAGRTNMAPVASNDTASTEEGVPVDIEVLANDSDADGELDATTVTVQGEPADGTAEVNADGTVTYTPDAGFTGSDSFTYTVQDDAGAGSGAASVTVTVIAAGNPPPSGGGGNGGNNGGGNGGGAAGLLWLAAMALAILHRHGRARASVRRSPAGMPILHALDRCRRQGASDRAQHNGAPMS